MIKRPVLPQYVIRLILTFIFISLLITPTPGQPVPVLVEYFYEDGCSKCAQAKPIVNKVLLQYNNITYSEYEYFTEYAGRMGHERLTEYGIYLVPAIVINRQTAITYSDYEGNTSHLEFLLVRAIENAPSAKDNESEVTASETPFKLTVLGVLIAGLVAGFNPCMLAVMAFMASVAISSKGGRRELLMIVTGFCMGIFVLYMLMGLGILGVVRDHPEIGKGLSLFLIVLIGLLGLWHFYDAYYMKIHSRSSLTTPESFIHFIKGWKGKNLLLMSFLVGGIFSLIKLPCIVPFYSVIINLIFSKGYLSEGSLYLGVFNLGVILPILILGILMAYGLSPDKVNDFREKKRIEIRILTGTILLLLVLVLYLDYTGQYIINP